MLPLVALVAVVSHATPVDARALDVGQTLNVVDELRARAKYDAAAAELRGLLERQKATGIGGPDFHAEYRRIMDLLDEIVELETVAQLAESDPRYARRYLALLVSPAQPKPRTQEQARALLLLAKYDARVKAMLDEAFPARVVVEAGGEVVDDDVIAFPFENALVEMSRAGLPVVRGAGASTLKVKLDIRENKLHNSLLEGTAMKSFAMTMSAVLEGAGGDALAKVATTTSILGINPGYAARNGMERCAQQLYASLVDDLAKRAALE